MNRQEKLLLIFSAFIVVVAILIYQVLPSFLLFRQTKNYQFIGVSVETQGDVKIRYGDTISWRSLDNKGRVYSNSYLFTGKNSSALFAFLDDSTIQLEENSLVYLDFLVNQKGKLVNNNDQDLKMDLVDGKIDINLKKRSKLKKIQVNDAQIDIEEGKAKIYLSNQDDSGMSVAVHEGEVNIDSNQHVYHLKNGEMLQVSEKSGAKKTKIPDQVLDEMRKIAKKRGLSRKNLPSDFRNRNNFKRLYEDIVDYLTDQVL